MKYTTSERARARAAYEAYVRASLVAEAAEPPWFGLLVVEQEAWCAAARAAVMDWRRNDG
jgi:hypothetical protein